MKYLPMNIFVVDHFDVNTNPSQCIALFNFIAQLRTPKEEQYKRSLLQLNLQAIQLVYYTFLAPTSFLLTLLLPLFFISCHFNNIFKTTEYSSHLLFFHPGGYCLLMAAYITFELSSVMSLQDAITKEYVTMEVLHFC